MHDTVASFAEKHQTWTVVMEIRLRINVNSLEHLDNDINFVSQHIACAKSRG